MADVELTITESEGTVTCTPAGGSFAASRGDRARWILKGKAVSFRLTFRVMPVNGIPTPGEPWPFEQAAPDGTGGNSSGWVREGIFERIIAASQGVFAYDIEVRTASLGLALLDPMIIVGGGGNK